MPPTPEPEKIREEAMKRIADRPVMVRDGDAIEELARAHERHAERIIAIANELRDVGAVNYLGNTVEGHAATNNIRAAVHTDPRSVTETLRTQARTARHIAESLREIGRRIDRTETQNQTTIQNSTS
ncbi:MULTISPECIES: hypothetical protein [Tsukamurella]|uniref:Uncharacterized protein n=1 Tax=Tsukamurella strandjordii TaxID=147577 RepID=A0AA90NK24_9ACTN|nr:MULTISPECIES: hypothetical protein [Tsukamurella]MDP0400245.1 hypothetical protein [Tsukamurella strandjordii]GIZ98515.1 hypothetical protein TTY48_31270 [Tsukamurella sp. TY48]